MSEFYKDTIVANREYGLSLSEIARVICQKSSTIMRKWNQWVDENYIERHAGSQRPHMAND